MRRSIQDRIVKVNYLRLAARAPERGAPADRRAFELAAAARAGAAAAARLHEPACVDTALADRIPGRRAQRAPQPVELLCGQLARHAARREPGAPERLIGQEVADAGDRALVEQSG